MTATLIDGKALAETVQAEVAAQTAAFLAQTGIQPGLATVLVGDDPASQTYVRMKQKRAREAGLHSVGLVLPETTTQAELLETIATLNADPAIHGILVQLPLPKHIHEETVLRSIKLEKDVDGFHPINLGLLALRDREPYAVACTPLGCMEMLERHGAQFKGANAVVIGRSGIVGLPAALLLLRRDCTVTICHSRTKDLPAICREADILIAAVGRAEMVKADWVKPGAYVIDVGINAVPDETAKYGRRLVGDVDFEAVKEVAGYLTPVPGGVGPMTIAMLLSNTLRLAQRSAAT